MKNENTEGKISNMCGCINLKTYSGIQEINFLCFLQVFIFSMVILAEGFVLMWFSLCFAEGSMERYEQLYLGGEKSKGTREIRLL